AGHRSGIDATTTWHVVTFNDRHALSEIGGLGAGFLSGRPTPDDHQIKRFLHNFLRVKSRRTAQPQIPLPPSKKCRRLPSCLSFHLRAIRKQSEGLLGRSFRTYKPSRPHVPASVELDLF